jgi:hypothetical protein
VKIDLNKMTKNFILSEAQRPPLVTMIVSLQEQVKRLEPRTVRAHLINEIRKAATRQSNEVKRLEEELNFLQEDKKDGK